MKLQNTTHTKMERSCVLLIDEMKIQGIYDYEKKNDTTMAPKINVLSNYCKRHL